MVDLARIDFNHVSKGRILEVVTEAVDANAASPLAALEGCRGDGGGTDDGRHELVARLPAHQPVQTGQTEAAADYTRRVPGEPALTA